MVWNWNTLNTCFLSSTWQIHSHSAFAGLCIGVVLLVILLFLLRRLTTLYDRYLIAQHQQHQQHQHQYQHQKAGGRPSSSESESPHHTLLAAKESHHPDTTAAGPAIGNVTTPGAGSGLLMNANANANAPPFRPNIYQQATRALLHTLHFAVAYWIMLLAMYYNGYIILCIILGAYVGFFLCQWEGLGTGMGFGAADGVRDSTGCHG